MLQPLRARGLLIATVCKLFLFGDIVMRVLFGIILFGLAAAPFSAVLWLDNGVTLQSGLSRSVT
jgi:hypothetical protein